MQTRHGNSSINPKYSANVVHTRSIFNVLSSFLSIITGSLLIEISEENMARLILLLVHVDMMCIEVKR
jgi:hypothetical protein